MGELTELELAERCFLAPSVVRHLAELGILAPDEDPERPFHETDVRRIRLAVACERAGLSLDGIGTAVAEGKISFGFLDMPQYAWPGFADRTYAEAAGGLGLTIDLVTKIQEALGFATPKPDDPIREDDLELLPALGLSASWGIPEETMIRVVRVYGEALRRIALAETQAFQMHIEQPLLASGMSAREMIEASSGFGTQFVAIMDQAIMRMYHRQQEHAWVDNLVGHIEDALEDLGLHERLERPPAMVFLDLTGYTRLTEERGDVAAAQLATNLAGIVQGVSQQHGGLPVKWLGDGVMFFFPDPGGAVVAALEMVERTPASGLPSAHVGVNAGPVIRQDGDYFGRTVNVAARIASKAGPDEVLVSDEVARVASENGVRFEDLGPTELKGVAKPVSLSRAMRA